MSYYSIWSEKTYNMEHSDWQFSGAVPPLIGWVAIEGQISLTAIALFLVVFCWQPIHFYALAIKRKDEYALANIPMLPSVKGFKRTRVSMFIWLIILLPVPLLLNKFRCRIRSVSYIIKFRMDCIRFNNI
ncbi:UbiA family prenyltransferase [Staphylococcus aureus]|nr:UbiA family prenyltransferase [Staphylococcus aureus]